MARKTIEKFKKQTETDGVEIIEMELFSYSYPKGGVGICPECGGKMNGIALDWDCEACELKLNGPLF